MKTGKQGNYLPFFAAFFFCFFVLESIADTGLQEPNDLVVFFKQAIKAPPDVEHFVAQRHDLIDRKPPDLEPGETLGKVLEFYEGARSGSNFFLRAIADPNLTPSGPYAEPFAVGRTSSNAYEFGKQSIAYGIGTNALVKNGDLYFSMVAEFLNMGLGQLKPETVTWNENRFSGTNIAGRAIFGELEVSNSMPHKLKISPSDGAPPNLVFDYSYPSPPNSLSGFPSKVVISTLFHKSVF